MSIQLNYTFNGVNYPNSWWAMGALNINLRNKTATVIMHGYITKAALQANPLQPLDVQNFSCSEPATFDFYFGDMNRVKNAAFVNTIENWLVVGDPGLLEDPRAFFAGGVVWSPVEYVASETGVKVSLVLGIMANNVISVTFDDKVGTGTSFITGVTIKVNGGSVAISSAAQPADLKIVQYTLAAPVSMTDNLTFEYAPSGIYDGNAIGISAIAAKTVSNTLGTGLNFSLPDNSGHLATVA